MARHEGAFPVRLMGRVLEVSVSGYSAYLRPPERWRAVIDDVLRAHMRKRVRVLTTNSNHDHPIAPYLLAREFDINGVALDRIWIGDITDTPTREGFLYLATV